jgi:hypothetical protein
MGKLGFMRRLLLALLAVTAALLAPAVTGAQTTTSSPVQEALDALQTDSVWVSPDNAADVSQDDAERLRNAIRASGVPNTYIAVFPPDAGDPFQLARDLAQQLGAGVYGVIAGPSGR